MRVQSLLLSILLGASTTTAQALEAHFEPLKFLLGHCWRAPISEDQADVQCFKAAYGGKLVQNNHEVHGTDPRYGGTTFYSWDPQNKRLRFHYFTSTGAVSEGHLVPIEDGFTIPETHTGSDGKVTGLESSFRRDGKLHFTVVTRQRKDDQWTELATLRYVRMEPAEAAVW